MLLHYLYRTTDSNKPPDYSETTTEYYPESSECVTDTGGDPPPPYGPPTYDQSVHDEVKEGGVMVVTEEGEELGEDQRRGDYRGAVNRTETTPSIASCYNGTMTVSHHEYNLDGEPPQEHMSTFQDLPSVTL